ncbi:MAG: MCP four helix bundle domain-containing protein, partial [Nitrospirae bacterium]|nr:MCP four helix bundle domain-containing protein [Nitrospirota bacterium]
MGWFYNMKTATKMIMGFLIVAVITAIVGVVGITNMGTINSMAAEMYEKDLLGISYLKDADVDLISIGRAERNYILSTTEDMRKKYIKQMDDFSRLFMEKLTKAKPLINSEKGKELFAKLEHETTDWEKLHNQVVEIASKEKLQEARESTTLSLGLARDKMNVVDDTLIEISKAREDHSRKLSDETVRIYNSSRNFMTGLIIAGILCGMILGIFISGSISNPLKSMVKAAERLALGEVDVDIAENTKDEVGELAQSLRHVIENIRESALAAEKIAAGDLSVEVKARSAKDVLSKSMLLVVETLRNLMAEAAMLTKAAVDGRLATRGSAENFNGGYREIVTGVNKTLDAVIGPLNVAANCV